MSLALDLHPFDAMRGLMVGATRLCVENDGWAHTVRDSCFLKPLPHDTRFEYYTDEGVVSVKEDQHGAIKYATAGELLAMPLDKETVVLPLTQAALAYLKSLPNDSPVILYFH